MYVFHLLKLLLRTESSLNEFYSPPFVFYNMIIQRHLRVLYVLTSLRLAFECTMHNTCKVCWRC